MKMGDNMKIEGAEDLISNLPDVLLQHILCFIPTKISISTSLLSRRWRHVWCEVPSLSLDVDTLTATSVNQTLTRYTAPKTTSFHLAIKPITENIPYIDGLIKFAMSHNFESLSLHLCSLHCDYELPEFFCNSSSVKQLNIHIFPHMIVPECTVSWTSLQKLSLRWCSLSDESMAKILSGCPVLENLTLAHIDKLNVLDLSKSLRLRTLEVQRNQLSTGPMEIVAPHIHCLRLYDSDLSCTLVDVSSLTEVNLESSVSDVHADYLPKVVLNMLKKLQNVEKLTFGGNFIQVDFLGNYLKLQGFNVNKCWLSEDRACWNEQCEDLKSEDVASLVELVLKNTKKLKKMVLVLDERYLKFKIEDVFPKLPRNKNVNVVISTTKSMALEKW